MGRFRFAIGNPAFPRFTEKNLKQEPSHPVYVTRNCNARLDNPARRGAA